MSDALLPVGGGCLFRFIFCLLLISGFAGYLPVVSCVLVRKWLIINDIRFCW